MAITFEDIKGLCRSEISQIRALGINETDFKSGLRRLESKITKELNIKNFKIDIKKRNNEDIVIYRFNINNKNMCQSGFIYSSDTFDDKLAECLENIHNSLEALKILNDFEDKLYNTNDKRNLKLEYIWGNSEFDSIYYWDYESAVIKFGQKSINNLIGLYKDGIESFKIKFRNVLNTFDITEITNIIDSLEDSEFGKLLEIKFETHELDKELTKNMLNREDIIQLCQRYTKDKNLELFDVEVIDQLGLFLALAKWNVDFNNKNVEIKIKDERVIDINSKEIISNYAICSRIENFMCLNNDEKAKIFN